MVSHNNDVQRCISLFFIGQGGGAEEQNQGRPFIGPAGQRLRKKILPLVFRNTGPLKYALSNNVRFHPPLNRKPFVIEVAACRRFLKRDILFLKPKLISALGNSAALSLSGFDYKGDMLDNHGRIKDTDYGIPAIATYHPSPLNPGKEIEDIIASDIIMAYQKVTEGKKK
jgi:DNA polymerase